MYHDNRQTGADVPAEREFRLKKKAKKKKKEKNGGDISSHQFVHTDEKGIHG